LGDDGYVSGAASAQSGGVAGFEALSVSWILTASNGTKTEIDLRDEGSDHYPAMRPIDASIIRCGLASLGALASGCK